MCHAGNSHSLKEGNAFMCTALRILGDYILIDTLKPATGQPCVPEQLSPTGIRKHTHVDFLGLRGAFEQSVSDQLGVIGRKRIHFHGNRRLNAGVEHVLLEQLTFLSNASIVLEDADTHRPTLRRRVKAQTIARKR